MNKFKKNREVDSRYLNVPVKYILNYDGANKSGVDKYEYESYEEWRQGLIDQFGDYDYSRESYEKIKQRYKDEGIITRSHKLVKKAKDKTLTIVDFYGKNALVAWRNNNTCKMGMTRLCPIVHKHGKVYIEYKGKLILISNNSGWVL